MQDRRPTHQGHADADGIRVSGARRRPRAWIAALAAVGVCGIALWLVFAPAPVASARRATEAGQDASKKSNDAPRASAEGAPIRMAEAREPRANPADPTDLANHFQPGDPEPTGAELIEALHAAGVRTGIGAFNPPGTSPPLAGLAVPEGFVLPPGYVRHHQVTDQGVPLEPILMFSPDFRLYDAQGRPVPLPADRVVPPEYAPPGMPLRRVHARTR